MANGMNIPFGMKLVYFCRHVAERQELFLSAEEKARIKTGKKYAEHPPVPVVEVGRVIDINDFSPERFAEEGGFETPFVIKGVPGSPVIEWRALRDICGDSIVPVHPAAGLGADWQYHRTRQMKLGDAMREMESGAAISVVSTSQIFVDHHELLDALNPDILSSKFGVSFVRQEMFVAGPGTGSAFHCAAGANFFHMVYGRKRWVLVKPADSFAMYPTIGRNRRSAIICSPINSETYETEQKRLYPLYDKIPKYSVMLEPGDILFIPSWWWHEVKNIEPTIGVPCRSLISGRNDFFVTLAILSPYGLKYLSRAVVGKLTRDAGWLMTDGIPRESFGGVRPRRR